MTIKFKRILACAIAITMAIGLIIQTMALTANASNTVSTQRFTDVTPDAWYYEAVNAMAEAGIVNGVGDGKFQPNRPMTAGELATVLWNMTYGSTWCKASELYNAFDNGYNTANKTNYTEPNYPGPKYDGWGIPKDNTGSYSAPYSALIPTTWDGPVALAIYGDCRIDPTSNNAPNAAARCQLNYSTGRKAGYVGGTSIQSADAPYYSRDMSGLAVVAMSKEYVTRGFAISELVNVLRLTGYLDGIYAASGNKTVYSTGASIPDWADITNVYHDVCSASSKNAFTMGATNELFHDYTWAWNYIDEPGKTVISGGYANTWFSADILLAYQAGLVSGKDASGRCDVNASMTRAEVCQMLYNAGAGKTKFVPKNYKNGGRDTTFIFIRDNKVYEFGTMYGHIYCDGPYQPNSEYLAYVANDPSSNYYVYSVRKYIDNRRQEWPTHPEFWGN